MQKKKESAKKPKSIDNNEEKFQKARAQIKKILTDGESDSPPEVERKITVEEESNDMPIQRKEDRTIEQRDFASLYQSNKLGKVDMTKIEKKDPHRNRKLIAWVIVGLLIISAAAVAGFYFFVNRQDQFSGENIAIEVEKPLIISSGEEIDFTIIINNQEEIGIKNAEVTLQFPEDFHYTASQPQPINEANNAWQLGDVRSNSAKEIVISGQLFGEIGSLANFRIILTYMPANFNSEFQITHSFTATINDSIIGLDLEMPVKVISGYSSEYKITYTNNAKEDIGNVRLALLLPDDLAATDFSPEATEGVYVWQTEKLESQESQTISFKGVLEAEAGTMREIKVEVGYVSSSGEYHRQVEETSIIFVVDPQLVLTLSIDEGINNNYASFAETLEYVIKYQNSSETEIKNMSITAVLTGEVLDWDSLVDVNQGIVSDNTITWDSDIASDLTSIEPGDEGEIQFTIDIKDNILAQESSDINYSIISKATALSNEVVDLEGSTLGVESNSITTKINSRLDLRAEGRYYNDEYLPVGSGPIPPEVGQATNYQIYWYLTNNANEVTDVLVTATLPQGVAWQNDAVVSAGNISYDPDTGTVTWSINKIPPHVGQLIPELNARFAIEVTPSQSNLGEVLVLLDESQVKADDSFTEQLLSQSKAQITSNLETDPVAAGQGVVQTNNSNTNSN